MVWSWHIWEEIGFFQGYSCWAIYVLCENSRERTTFSWDTCRRGTIPPSTADLVMHIASSLNCWVGVLFFPGLALCSNMSNDGFWLCHSMQYGFVDIPELLVMLRLLVALRHHFCLLFAKEGLAQHSSWGRWCFWIDICSPSDNSQSHRSTIDNRWNFQLTD